MKKENRNAHNMMPEPIYSDIVAIAREIARTAHQGQFDKANQPYIRHPEAVSRIAVENFSWPAGCIRHVQATSHNRQLTS